MGSDILSFLGHVVALLGFQQAGIAPPSVSTPLPPPPPAQVQTLPAVAPATAAAPAATPAPALPSFTKQELTDNTAVMELKGRTGLTVEMVTQSFTTSWNSLSGADTVQGDSADAQAVEQFANILAQEMNKYPSDYFATAGVKGFVLAANLNMNGTHWNAIPEVSAGYVLYDVPALLKTMDAKQSTDTTYCIHSIHHEMYHVIDAIYEKKLFVDPEWEALNSSLVSFQGYPKDIEASRFVDRGAIGPFDNAAEYQAWLAANDQTVWHYEANFAGFLNRYSLTGVQEDKAEIFSALMVFGSDLNEKTVSDPVLANKMALMKARNATISPGINETFWRARVADSTGRPFYPNDGVGMVASYASRTLAAPQILLAPVDLSTAAPFPDDIGINGN